MNNMQVAEKNRLLQSSLMDRKVYCALGNISGEVSGAGYQRTPITFTKPENGQVQNAVALEFPIAQSDWGEVSLIQIYDQETGGTKLWEATAEVSKTIGVASQYKIPEGYMILRLV